MSDPKTDAKASAKTQPQKSPGEITDDPTEVVDIDDRQKEIMRLINQGERQIGQALEQLKAGATGSKSGAAEFYEDAIEAVASLGKAIRNASMNHAVFVDHAAKNPTV